MSTYFTFTQYSIQPTDTCFLVPFFKLYYHFYSFYFTYKTQEKERIIPSVYYIWTYELTILPFCFRLFSFYHIVRMLLSIVLCSQTSITFVRRF